MSRGLSIVHEARAALTFQLGVDGESMPCVVCATRYAVIASSGHWISSSHLMISCLRSSCGLVRAVDLRIG